MKIKHWQGYGCVNAKKIKKSTKRGMTTLVVEVTGNHEWGLRRDDMYDLKRWLVDRFDRSAKDIPYWNMEYVCGVDYFKAENGCDTERAIYTFTYPSKEAA